MTMTPKTGTAPTAVKHPAPTSTTAPAANVAPLQGRQDRAEGNLNIYGNKGCKPLHATVRILRQERRYLIADIRNLTYSRTTPHALKETARRMHKKLKGCGETLIGPDVALIRHLRDGEPTGGTVRGVRTCHDRFCPVCAARIEGREAQDTRAALLYLHHTGALEGNRLYFFTATMRHTAADDHALNFANLQTVLGKLPKQAWWKAAVAGSLVKLEVEGTLDPKKNGLHPHAHALLVIPETVDVDQLTARLRRFFVDQFEKLAPGENRIGWQGSEWFKPVTGENLPFYLAKKRWGIPDELGKRWSIAEEMTASQAKYGGFWQRPTEDLVVSWGLLEGVRTLRPGGIVREALRAVRARHEAPVSERIATIDRAAWQSMTPEVRDAISSAIENPGADPAWIRWTLNNLHDMIAAARDAMFNLIADARVPREAVEAVIAAHDHLDPQDFFGLVVETGRLARAA